jgi:hypothetical protein
MTFNYILKRFKKGKFLLLALLVILIAVFVIVDIMMTVFSQRHEEAGAAGSEAELVIKTFCKTSRTSPVVKYYHLNILNSSQSKVLKNDFSSVKFTPGKEKVKRGSYVNITILSQGREPIESRTLEVHESIPVVFYVENCEDVE